VTEPSTEPGGARVVQPMAPRSRRTLYAYGYVAGVAVAAAGALGLRGAASALVQLAGFVVMVGLWFTLRRATRLVVDAPEDALADRYVRLRDKVFLLAYQMLAVVVLGVCVVLFLGSRGGLSEPVATALAWAAFGSALGLPLVVAAVSLPDSA
jgi:hypothetical protein